MSYQTQSLLYPAQPLRYAYQAEARYQSPILLGSVMRALGKGWRIAVVGSTSQLYDFRLLHDQLRQEWRQHLALFESGQPGDELPVSKLKEHQPHLVVSFQPWETVCKSDPALLPSSHLMTIDHLPLWENYDLISHLSIDPISESIDSGVQAITGSGKGKTTTALGLGMQAFLKGKRVVVLQWFKEKKTSAHLSWAINEHFFSEKIMEASRLIFEPTGLGFFGSPTMDRVTGDQAYQHHRHRAYQGLERAQFLVENQAVDFLILDELVDTVAEIAGNISHPLIDLIDIQKFLSWLIDQPKIEVVVTGRRVTDDWRSLVAQSLEVREIKHPWSNEGKGAVSGLDY